MTAIDSHMGLAEYLPWALKCIVSYEAKQGQTWPIRSGGTHYAELYGGSRGNMISVL